MDRRTFLAGLGALAAAGGVAAAVGADGATGRRLARGPAPHYPGTRGAPATARAGGGAPHDGAVHFVDGLPVAERTVAENSNPGTLGWLLRGRQDPASPGIEGYVDKVSVEAGEELTLFVNTSALRFRAEIYRMGYYQGLGARLVHRSPELAGRPQPAPTRSAVTNMVECHWAPSRVFGVDPAWVPGNYLIKLVGSGGEERYVPFTVRDDQSRAAIVLQGSVTTWQAYNLWGGYSLYGGGPTGALAQRSRIVSFDRPYGPNLDAGGSGDWLGNEFPMVYLAEHLGLDVTYWTDVDLHARPHLLARHRCLVSLGHDEYWSMAMRLGAATGLAGGVNLAFLGANACYRQIRLDPSPNGPDRREVCYKDAPADPELARDPALATAASWATGPVPWFESRLIGVMYQAFQPSGARPTPLVITDPGSWLLEGTGLAEGSQVPGVVGSEFDAYEPSEGPSDLSIVAHSPIDSVLGPLHADTSYYSVPGAGGVFASGTAQWVSLLWDGARELDRALSFGIRPAQPTLTTITKNVLAGFSGEPASAVHPSKANWSRFYRPGGPVRTGIDV